MIFYILNSLYLWTTWHFLCLSNQFLIVSCFKDISITWSSEVKPWTWNIMYPSVRLWRLHEILSFLILIVQCMGLLSWIWSIQYFNLTFDYLVIYVFECTLKIFIVNFINLMAFSMYCVWFKFFPVLLETRWLLSSFKAVCFFRIQSFLSYL